MELMVYVSANQICREYIQGCEINPVRESNTSYSLETSQMYTTRKKISVFHDIHSVTSRL